jgi:transcriptional regulator with XRE-family HTH domain
MAGKSASQPNSLPGGRNISGDCVQSLPASKITAMTFAQKLNRLCRLREFSNRKLAELVGEISRSKAGAWRTGSNVPNLKELIRLAELFGVSVEYLVHDEIEEYWPDGLAPDERTVLKVYRARKAMGKLSEEEAIARLSAESEGAWPTLGERDENRTGDRELADDAGRSGLNPKGKRDPADPPRPPAGRRGRKRRVDP